MPFHRPTPCLLRWTLSGFGGLALGCGEAPTRPQAEAPTEARAAALEATPPSETCPASGVAPARLPRTRPEHETLDYWLTRTAEVADLDRPVLAAAEVRALNAAGRHSRAQGFGGRANLRAPIDVDALASGLQSRLGFLRGRFTGGHFVQLDGSLLPAALQERYAVEVTAQALAQGLRAPALSPGTDHEGELRVALDLIPIHCGPQTEPYYTPSRDPDFDRNLCSMARAQELVQVLSRWGDDLLLVRTSYVVGWIDARRAALSPPLAPEPMQAFLEGPYDRVAEDLSLPLLEGGRAALPFASLVPRAPGAAGRVLVATAEGVRTGIADGPAFAEVPRALTRRALLTDAFAYLGQPYGWGGRMGGRDCSRYLMDLFAGLGVELPRHTSDQALAGNHVVEVAAALSEPKRLALLDEQHRRGIVLLHFPGHIMLYLGRDLEGAPMAIHSFAEFLVPCADRAEGAPAGEGETLLKVDGVHVSDLELGRGTSRTAFIQRITKITVLGAAR